MLVHLDFGSNAELHALFASIHLFCQHFAVAYEHMIGTLRLLGANRVNSSILLLQRFLACFTLSCAKTKLDLLLNYFGTLRGVRRKPYL